MKPLVPASYLPDHYLPFSLPGIGLVIAFVAVTLLGFLTANLVGRSVVEFGEVLLARTPVISGLYKGLRQIFETLFSANGTSFRTVGLVEFPVKGTWSVVFVSAPAGPDVQTALGEENDHVGVFLPCAPNPTTGFFFYLPRADIIEVPMSIDDAAKLVMSAGVIQPEDPQVRLQAMAAVDPLGSERAGRRAGGGARSLVPSSGQARQHGVKSSPSQGRRSKSPGRYMTRRTPPEKRTRLSGASLERA